MQKEMQNARQQSARAEAALWVVRTPQAGDGEHEMLDSWLSRDTTNASAYAESMSLWHELGQIPLKQVSQKQNTPYRFNRRYAVIAAMAACLLLIVAAGLHFMLPQQTYYTAIGKQRVVHLEDGTIVTMNTNTELRVHYSSSRRAIDLPHGEALFEVAHNPKRPFVVIAADEHVKAVGTSFVVRNENHRVDVILLSGIVEIVDRDKKKKAVQLLHPGERLSMHRNKKPALDRPKIAVVTAWRQGEIILDETPLRDAVAEMNRYSIKPIILDFRTPDDLRLNGVFRIADCGSFASTVAKIYNFKLHETPDKIAITR